MGVHEFVVVGLQLPVILEHLVQLLAKSLFISFDARQLMACLFSFGLFLIKQALILALNLCNALGCDFVRSLGSIKLIPHRFDHFLTTLSVRALGLG